MSLDRKKFTVGDFWLDKRRDGKSPNIWQIATKRSRTVVYKSTRCIDHEAAKEVLRAHEAQTRSKQSQGPDEAELLPHIFHYLREQGPDIKRLDHSTSSLRSWVGFFMQDELTTGVRVGDLNKIVVDRFRHWRMAPHEWAIEWPDGETYRHKSPGVKGETVQRNIEDLRAVLAHAEAAGRIPMHPKLPSVPTKDRSKRRRYVFTVAQLGAIVGYARQEPDVERWLWLMIGTGVRPDAALAFNPDEQWHGDLIDLQPQWREQTAKRNPVVPVIEPLRAMMGDWGEGGAVLSRKRWWRTMRVKLGIPATHEPKAIRRTVASWLRAHSVPGEQISGLLGHKDSTDSLEVTTEGYAQFEPSKTKEAQEALTKLWGEVKAASDMWTADHSMTIKGNNVKIIVARNGKNI